MKYQLIVLSILIQLFAFSSQANDVRLSFCTELPGGNNPYSISLAALYEVDKSNAKIINDPIYFEFLGRLVFGQISCPLKSEQDCYGFLNSNDLPKDMMVNVVKSNIDNKSYFISLSLGQYGYFSFHCKGELGE